MNDFERIVVTELGFLIEIEERAEGQVKGDAFMTHILLSAKHKSKRRTTIG